MLVLFNILRILGHCVKSLANDGPSDSEKGRSTRGLISRPKYDWNPQSTFASPPQAQSTKTAPPARPPGTVLQKPTSRPTSFGRALFKSHKKSGSTSSTTRLLTPEPLSRNHSPSPSLDGSEISVATTVVRKPVMRASVLDAELPLPLAAMRKPTETADPPSQNGSAGLTPHSYLGRSRISSGLTPIAVGYPSPQTAAPFLEVTLHSPAVNSYPTNDDGGLISMYISRKSAESWDLPPFPAPAVPRDSPLGSILSDHVPLEQRLPAASSVGPQAFIPRGGVVSPPKAALVIGSATGGYGHIQSSAPTHLPPAPVVSPESSVTSHYSDTDSWTSRAPQEPESSFMFPVLGPVKPLRLSKTPRMLPSPRTETERRLLDPPSSSRVYPDRTVPRALPVPPPSQSGGRQRSGSLYSYASSRQGYI